MWKHLIRVLIALLLFFQWQVFAMFLGKPVPVVAGASLDADVTVTYTVSGSPGTPTGFTATDLGCITVGMNWTIETYSMYTMIRGSRDDYPSSVAAGELIYYGDAESYNATGFALDITTYYLSAFGYLSDNVTHTTNYATASVGGEGMTEVATSLDSLTSVFGEIATVAMLAGGSILVLGLFAIALWRREVVYYAFSGIVSFFIGGSWLGDYLGVSIVIMGLGCFQLLEALLLALSSGGPSRGASQFKSIVETIKGWF